jgi:hypothetical protein
MPRLVAITQQNGAGEPEIVSFTSTIQGPLFTVARKPHLSLRRLEEHSGKALGREKQDNYRQSGGTVLKV